VVAARRVAPAGSGGLRKRIGRAAIRDGPPCDTAVPSVGPGKRSRLSAGAAVGQRNATQDTTRVQSAKVKPMCRGVILSAWLIVATAGCQGGACQLCKSGGSSTSGGQPASAGELGGACLPDGTCGAGLACVDGTCLPDSTGEPLLFFQNNSGTMCLAAVNWLDGVRSDYPTLVIDEHLTYEPGESELLAQLQAQFQTSQGVSTSFEYLPIIFFQGQAFSGFNDEVAQMLEELLPPADTDGS
jgi:hypothetical protein